MKPKFDEKGNFAYEGTGDNAKPIFIHDDGKEYGYDVPASSKKIGDLNGEAKSNRERAEKAEQSLKMYEGITDPALALRALETVKNLDGQKTADAGDLERRLAEQKKSMEDQYRPLLEASELRGKTAEDKTAALQAKVAFGQSKFIEDECSVKPDVIRSMYGDSFKLEEDVMVGYDQSGNKIFSRSRPGEVANFDEAIEIMVGNYAHKDTILKGSGGSGAGLKSENGNNSSQKSYADCKTDEDKADWLKSNKN